MPCPQKRCRICKRSTALTHLNQWRICPICEPRWKEKTEKKGKLKKALNLAYEKLTEKRGILTCDICGRTPKTRRLNVDHNHKTNEIRGLLCYRCNYGLAWFRDDAERMHAAAEYLQRPPIFRINL